MRKFLAGALASRAAPLVVIGALCLAAALGAGSFAGQPQTHTALWISGSFVACVTDEEAALTALSSVEASGKLALPGGAVCLPCGCEKKPLCASELRDALEELCGVNCAGTEEKTDTVN